MDSLNDVIYSQTALSLLNQGQPVIAMQRAKKIKNDTLRAQVINTIAPAADKHYTTVIGSYLANNNLPNALFAAQNITNDTLKLNALRACDQHCIQVIGLHLAAQKSADAFKCADSVTNPILQAALRASIVARFGLMAPKV